MIKELDNELTYSGFSQKLGECVEYHNEIINYTKTMEIIVQAMFFAQFLVTGIIICGHVFQLIAVSHNYMNVIQIIAFLTFVTSDLMFYCWYGNQITNEVSIFF